MLPIYSHCPFVDPQRSLLAFFSYLSPKMAGLCRQLVLLYLLCAVSADIAPFYDSEAYAAGLYGNYSRQAYISDLSFEGPVAHIMVPPQEGVSPSRFVGWAPGGPPPERACPALRDNRSHGADV